MSPRLTWLTGAQEGWIREAKAIPSPHYNQRPEGALISLLVVHCISLPEGHYDEGHLVDLFFQNRLDAGDDAALACTVGLKVSSHFLITRKGQLKQYVSCDDRAWHAGVSSYEGQENCNDFSVGVELEGCVAEAYTEAQYRCLQTLYDALCQRYPHMRGRVTTHQAIAPGRKDDPGPFFQMHRLTL